MKAGLAPRTAQYAVAVVSLLWNTAFAQEFVTGENPARRVRRPKIDNRRLRFLSKDEADALLAELKNISLELHDECVLALYCGLRAGEIHNLTWGAIDFINDQVLIRDPKNGQNRFAFLTEPVKAMLDGVSRGRTRKASSSRLQQGENAFRYPVPSGTAWKNSASTPG